MDQLVPQDIPAALVRLAVLVGKVQQDILATPDLLDSLERQDSLETQARLDIQATQVPVVLREDPLAPQATQDTPDLTADSQATQAPLVILVTRVLREQVRPAPPATQAILARQGRE